MHNLQGPATVDIQTSQKPVKGKPPTAMPLVQNLSVSHCGSRRFLQTALESNIRVNNQYVVL